MCVLGRWGATDEGKLFSPVWKTCVLGNRVVSEVEIICKSKLENEKFCQETLESTFF